MNCLETPVILKQILENFSDNELLQLSLVNKKWNYEARSVLRDRATLTAIIRSNQLCQRVIDFAADLTEMRVIPFAGIKLFLSCRPCLSVAKGALEESCKTILKKLPCRHFSLHSHDAWEILRDTPALELVTEFFKGYCNIMEELSLIFCRTKKEMPQYVVQDHKFLRLKTLKIEVLDRASADESYASFIKALVSHAPNLEELHIGDRLFFKKDVLEGSSAVLVPCLSFNPLCELVCDGLVGALRPTFINVKQIGSLDVQLLNRYIPRVLQASLPTLSIFHMDLLFAVPLMRYEIYLENVAVLLIRVNENAQPEHFQPRISKLLKKFDFTRIFPKVSQVEIGYSWRSAIGLEHVSAFVEQWNPAWKETLPDRAVNIKQLSLMNNASDSTVAFLAQMFPDVERLFVSSSHVQSAVLRDHFRCLKQIIPTFPPA